VVRAAAPEPVDDAATAKSKFWLLADGGVVPKTLGDRLIDVRRGAWRSMTGAREDSVDADAQRTWISSTCRRVVWSTSGGRSRTR
jgi:hypothetical protein